MITKGVTDDGKVIKLRIFCFQYRLLAGLGLSSGYRSKLGEKCLYNTKSSVYWEKLAFLISVELPQLRLHSRNKAQMESLLIPFQVHYYPLVIALPQHFCAQLFWGNINI